MTQYVKRSEFRCPCCGLCHVDDWVVNRFNEARGIAGVPFIINSGYRCERKNAQLVATSGASKTSAHMAGLAADLKAEESGTRFRIVDGLLQAGFLRIGIYPTFIHADLAHVGKPAPVLFLGR